MTRTTFLPHAALALLGAASVFTGCAGYANYPKLGRDDVAVNNPNTAPVPEAEFVALRWVVRRYPVNGPYTVNFPEGTYRRTGERLTAMLDDPNAKMLTPAAAGLPCFHVKRVWVRGERATVEILRPVLRPPMDIPTGSESKPLYQSFWVKCEAGWKPWRVVHARAWPIGKDVPPNLQGWPDEPPPAGSTLANPGIDTFKEQGAKPASETTPPAAPTGSEAPPPAAPAEQPPQSPASTEGGQLEEIPVESPR